MDLAGDFGLRSVPVGSVDIKSAKPVGKANSANQLNM